MTRKLSVSLLLLIIAAICAIPLIVAAIFLGFDFFMSVLAHLGAGTLRGYLALALAAVMVLSAIAVSLSIYFWVMAHRDEADDIDRSRRLSIGLSIFTIVSTIAIYGAIGVEVINAGGIAVAAQPVANSN